MQVSIENIGKIFKDAEKKCIKACINTVNIQAASSRNEGIINIKKNFTLRNTWTERNIIYTQCPQNVTDINQIQSEVGATQRAEYMERQEKGGIHKAKGNKLAIPSTMARGGASNKKVKSSLYLSKNGLVSGPTTRATTRKSQYVARAFVAAKNKLFLSANKTLFQVTKFTKSGDSISFKQTPIYNVKFTQTKTPAQPWLKPATDQQAKEAQQIYNYQLDKLFIGV